MRIARHDMMLHDIDEYLKIIIQDRSMMMLQSFKSQYGSKIRQERSNYKLCIDEILKLRSQILKVHLKPTDYYDVLSHLSKKLNDCRVRRDELDVRITKISRLTDELKN